MHSTRYCPNPETRNPKPDQAMNEPEEAASQQPEFTHFDASGAARMVDVGEKPITARRATAEAFVRMQPETLERIVARQFRKGDVLEVARLAGLMAVKRTADLIPLCHPLPIESTQVDLQVTGPNTVQITATVAVTAKTGVEMEALTAVSVAALTIYDMCKSVDRSLEIGPIRLLEKSGGRSGHFRHPHALPPNPT